MAHLARCLAAVVAAGSISACNSGGGEHFCTAIFAYITVVAHDASGNPVTDLAITDTVLRTHEGFSITQAGSPIAPAGSHTIFDDGQVSRIREGGDSVRVTGTKPGLRFVADYVFDVPEGCHIHKVSGPDTVVVVAH